MSGALQGGASATKAVVNDAPNGQPAAASAKPAPQLEEDDEFEDFPVEGMYCYCLTS
jgi:26 proteasome complex subunit DSS1